MVAAETGSGKTGAFVLPILQVVHEAMALPSQPLGASSADPCCLNLDDRDSDIALTPDGIHSSLLIAARAKCMNTYIDELPNFELFAVPLSLSSVNYTSSVFHSRDTRLFGTLQH